VSDPGRWPRRSLYVAGGFGAVLIVTGVTGLPSPHADSLMSHAVPYDLFHIVFGSLGLGLGLRKKYAAAAWFNIGFGAIDLWQVLAGLTGIFPAGLFGLRWGDHVVHLVIGVGLIACGLAGRRSPGPSMRD
jgi:hypothetical protein